MKKKRKYVRRNGVQNHAAEAKSFDLNSLKPEDDVTLVPRNGGVTSEMYEKLDQLKVRQSYRLPMELLRIYTNAKVTHKRLTKKVFIMRKIDKYNFRCWRMPDDTVLTTRRVVSKQK